jgi:hypothetical protein
MIIHEDFLDIVYEVDGNENSTRKKLISLMKQILPTCSEE